jgi:hypothetical protein
MYFSALDLKIAFGFLEVVNIYTEKMAFWFRGLLHASMDKKK